MREFELLNHIFQHNAKLPPGVTIPPGDDMGAVIIDGGNVLVTVDQILDGIHFKLASTPLEKIARKAITRNLSDVAAMAAQPSGAVVAATLPRDLGEDRAKTLFDAMRQTAEHYHCPLIGGDISIWAGPLALCVTIFAEPAGITPVLRRGAKVGDVICVTGSLGNSLATGHHLDFEPRISLARELAGNSLTRPNCMIDLSDGLARDLGHLCRVAGLGAQIDAGSLPLRTGADWRAAVSDGEDYELCFTIDAERAANLPAAIDDVPITRIGVITAGSDVVVRSKNGQEQSIAGLGWEHRGS